MRKQKKIIIMLSITLANLIAFGAISAYFFGKVSPVDSQNPPSLFPNEEQHIIQRQAQPSLSPTLAWELSIGGSSNDEVLEVYSLNNLYLFGQSTSKNYDFNTSGGTSTLFCARVSKGGSILGISLFGTENNDFYVNSTMSLNYFAVLYNTNTANGDFSVALLGYDGSLYKSRNFGNEDKEEGRYITFFNQYIVVVSQYTNHLGKVCVRIIYLDEELNIIFDRRPTRDASLSFVCLLPYDSTTLLLVANATEGLASYCTLYKIRQDLPPEPFDQQKNVSHEAIDAMPYTYENQGYLILYKTIDDGSMFLRYINRTLSVGSNISLRQSAMDGGRLMLANSGYYAQLFNQAGGILIHINSSLVQISDPLFALDHFAESYVSPVSTVIVGTHENKIVLLSLQERTTAFRQAYATMPSRAVALANTDGGIYIFGNVEGVNADVSVQYGAKDVWLARILA